MTDKIDISAEAVEQIAQIADAWGQVNLVQGRDEQSYDMARIAETLRTLSARLAEVEAERNAWMADSGAAWDKCDERRVAQEAAEAKLAAIPSSDALIRAALEAAANMLEPKNPREDWTDFAKQHHADAIAIRAIANDPEAVARIIKAAEGRG